MASLFNGAIGFLHNIGVYDVVLPFLLVFTIVYAILEKTAVFGMEDGKTKKNLNSMAAFVIGFLVIASTSLVASMNEFVANMVLLLVLSVTYLLLVGSFTKADDMQKGISLTGTEKKVFTVVMAIGIFLIFFNAMKVEDTSCGNNLYSVSSKCSWLDVGFNYIINHVDSTMVGALALVIGIGAIVYFITKDGGSPTQK